MHANAGPERRQARCEQPALKVGVLISVSCARFAQLFWFRIREPEEDVQKGSVRHYRGSQLPNACGTPSHTDRNGHSHTEFWYTRAAAHPRQSFFLIELEPNAVACTLSFWGCAPALQSAMRPNTRYGRSHYVNNHIECWGALHHEPSGLPTLESSKLADKLEGATTQESRALYRCTLDHTDAKWVEPAATLHYLGSQLQNACGDNETKAKIWDTCRAPSFWLLSWAATAHDRTQRFPRNGPTAKCHGSVARAVCARKDF